MLKSAALILVSAIAIRKDAAPKSKKDINCRLGDGANSVGSTVCDLVKDAVDVKPWPRTTPAPDTSV